MVADTSNTILRILIADDNERVRRGVAGLLASEPNWHICGEASDGPEALLKASELLPDLILLDISMPGIRREWLCGQGSPRYRLGGEYQENWGRSQVGQRIAKHLFGSDFFFTASPGTRNLDAAHSRPGLPLQAFSRLSTRKSLGLASARRRRQMRHPLCLQN